MLIKTQTFNITPKELRKILMIQYYKQRRAWLIFTPLLAIFNFFIAKDAFNQFLTYFLFVTFITTLIAPWLWNFRKIMPVANFINRYCEIDENFLTLYFEDGSIFKYKFEHFMQAGKVQGYYVLYLTAAGAINYIPATAFESEKDINRFELLLQGKQLLKLWK
jgi:hypothetical protein